jgi:hypothetical protein
MELNLDRGQVVLAPDPYNQTGYRPFVIISDETYPFYPDGYLGAPVTTQNKQNTFVIQKSDITSKTEPLDVWPSYVNPYSPAQVNSVVKPILQLSDDYVDMICENVIRAMGMGEL